MTRKFDSLSTESVYYHYSRTVYSPSVSETYTSTCTLYCAIYHDFKVVTTTYTFSLPLQPWAYSSAYLSVRRSAPVAFYGHNSH